MKLFPQGFVLVMCVLLLYFTFVLPNQNLFVFERGIKLFYFNPIQGKEQMDKLFVVYTNFIYVCTVQYVLHTLY